MATGEHALPTTKLAEATGWLENYREFWEGTYRRLDVLLEEMKSDEHSADAKPAEGGDR